MGAWGCYKHYTGIILVHLLTESICEEGGRASLPVNIFMIHHSAAARAAPRQAQ